MAKKRKTRQEKILSDSRSSRIEPSSLSQSISDSNLANSKAVYSYSKSGSLSPLASTPIITHDYSYVNKDLKHTALITGAIILTELVLSFFLRSI